MARKTNPLDEHDPTGVDVVVCRVLDAPVAEVWRAWSDPEYVKRWWGPHGFTAPLAEMDFRVGGSSLVCMSSPDTGERYNTWSYERIEPMRLIELVLNFTDRDGVSFEPASIGIDGVPRDVHHRITIDAVDVHRTELTVREVGYAHAQAAELSKAGLEECLDKMAAWLARASES